MTDTSWIKTDVMLKEDFNASAVKPAKKKHRPSIKLSFRVTAEEKDCLSKSAGKMALSAYIRQKLFGDKAEQRPKRYQKKQPRPTMDAIECARVLGNMGQSELAASMLALSMLAQSGELDVTPEVSGKLERACDDIHDMKQALIVALGIKPQGSLQ